MRRVLDTSGRCGHGRDVATAAAVGTGVQAAALGDADELPVAWPRNPLTSFHARPKMRQAVFRDERRMGHEAFPAVSALQTVLKVGSKAVSLSDSVLQVRRMILSMSSRERAENRL